VNDRSRSAGAFALAGPLSEPRIEAWFPEEPWNSTEVETESAQSALGIESLNQRFREEDEIESIGVSKDAGEFHQIVKKVCGQLRVSEETGFRRNRGPNPAFEESRSRRNKGEP
jgi:hypothetical protein